MNEQPNLNFQQEVKLNGDDAFRGLYEGWNRQQKAMLVTITEPGATGKRKGSIKWFPLADVVPARTTVSGGVAVVRKVKDGRK